MLLEVKNLITQYKSYWYTYHVLDKVGLSVLPGEKVGLIGESGSGKTTLLKSILQILPPQGRILDGEILWKGVDLLKADKSFITKVRRKEVGMVFQDPLAALSPVYKIKDQMLEVLKQVYDGYSKSDLLSIAEELLRSVLLPDPARVLDSYPFQLSGGMRQRVVIAMALASARDLLLADEPTTNLDVTIQDQILKLIDKLVREKGVGLLLVSHALGMIAKMTQRVYVMCAGNVVEEAPTSELFKESLHPYTRLLIDSAPRLSRIVIGEGIRGHPPDYRWPPPGCRFNSRCPFVTEVCKKERPPWIKVTKSRFVLCHIYKEGK
ncbi:MAG: ABC transporter ATP-binding protein [Zestosphaera sp.]